MRSGGAYGGNGRQAQFSAVCGDYRKDGFKSREDAEAWIRRVEDAGHCTQRHQIVDAAS